MDSPLAEVAGILADVAGTNPATGTWRFYVHDHLGSTRGLYDGSKSVLGGYEYSPYGEVYASGGTVSLDGLAAAFTGKPWDAAAQMYYFPYRWYSPSAGRWLTRDPLGMADGPNVYGYAKSSPVLFRDMLGLDAMEDFLGCETMQCLLTITCCTGLVSGLISEGPALLAACANCAGCIMLAGGPPVGVGACAFNPASWTCAAGVAVTLVALGCCLFNGYACLKTLHEQSG